MIVGIVGHEEKKFTSLGKMAAEIIISQIISKPDVTEVVSGKCHLGGIDIWAAEIGKSFGKTVTEFAPKIRAWEGGYKQRNLLIAQKSDIVHSIVVDILPTEYTGMTFPLCYHCSRKDHVKSGGCWTMIQAMKMGKRGEVHIIKNY